jgi:hypothetical protein
MNTSVASTTHMLIVQTAKELNREVCSGFRQCVIDTSPKVKNRAKETVKA